LSSPVSAEFLLRGAVYALEQCGLSLRGANILYRGGSYASVIALASFAMEELGKHKILLGMWREAVNGTRFTKADVEDACRVHKQRKAKPGHVIKQEKGMAGLTRRTSADSELGRALQARTNASPGSEECKNADAKIQVITNSIKEPLPKEQYNARLKALYVDLISESEWNRPADITQQEAYDFSSAALNDYSIRIQGYMPQDADLLNDRDPKLYSVLEEWLDRPKLWPPERLPFP